ncbi:hypothetical protein quinque_002477 [Culex quinquefasciatus]
MGGNAALSSTGHAHHRLQDTFIEEDPETAPATVAPNPDRASGRVSAKVRLKTNSRLGRTFTRRSCGTATVFPPAAEPASDTGFKCLVFMVTQNAYEGIVADTNQQQPASQQLRIPTQKELQFHTQSIMQNAALHKAARPAHDAVRTGRRTGRS